MSPLLLAPTGPPERWSDPEGREQHREAGGQDRWAPGLTKAAAEDALDWLEAHGHRRCQVSYVAGEGFRIRGWPGYQG
jgi:hypothetical protein